MPLRFSLCFILVLCCLLGSTAAMAQTEPDTVRRKRELPTGPTVEPQQQRQPRVVQPQPQPEVIRPQVVRPGEEEPQALLDRMFWGGSFGLQFGTFTNVSLLPVLGFRATETFWLGIGGVYHYQRYVARSLHNYGARFFAQQQVFNNFLIHAEYEQLSVEYLYQNHSTGPLEKARISKGIPMAGLGYRQKIGERGAADILLLYNFNDTNPSPYSNPVIRAGFSFPFRR
ncbi:hypothetical protein [uncultured Pontibacter sp.]|uniref:hypothetical protein n=1 Tax=uncultured Pontibacter sp. TaxID=453356 RepID=UPI00260BB988|nr:hypothetical protein [uncultured Pontibacter sp.]